MIVWELLMGLLLYKGASQRMFNQGSTDDPLITDISDQKNIHTMAFMLSFMCIRKAGKFLDGCQFAG
jgi:hypothetical protein